MAEIEISDAIWQGLPKTDDMAMLTDIADWPSLMHVNGAVEALIGLVNDGTIHQTDLERFTGAGDKASWPVTSNLGSYSIQNTLRILYSKPSGS